MRQTLSGFCVTRVTPALLLGGSIALAGCSGPVPVSSAGSGASPVVEIASPAPGSSLCGAVILSAAASSDTLGVQFVLDGVDFGPEVTSVPFSYLLNTNNLANSGHTLTAQARDESSSQTSAPVSVTVDNTTA